MRVFKIFMMTTGRTYNCTLSVNCYYTLIKERSCYILITKKILRIAKNLYFYLFFHCPLSIPISLLLNKLPLPFHHLIVLVLVLQVLANQFLEHRHNQLLLKPFLHFAQPIILYYLDYEFPL